ncbi:CapA family protein [Sphingomonas sp. SUN039]|uniref:CapA family protein n=1 Tax=Sphingomonas sp. SUN039 TaxID=2937787 RepID=UPI0021642BAB|nr:CapA family protein [Sphingomonas sp. SUN039]UVO54383.1 CapA family protein [Sphingomonas sp. SUN039]
MARMMLTGDIVLDAPDPDHWLTGIAPATRAADLTIGHLEVPHTDAPSVLAGDVPAPGADPANLAALQRAGFGVLTLAGNHIADCGGRGIADTRAGLASLGIAATGAGADLVAASAPALTRLGDTRVAVFSYNCVGPENAWATETRAGCNWLRIETEDGSAIAPSAPLSRIGADVADRLKHDLSGIEAELKIVALHKGIVHTPARLAPYERELARLAIDAGGDVVIGHHAHIVRGVEFYRGKPVFHGLGNGCVVTTALSPGQDDPAREAWVARRKTLFGFEPDPAYTLAPFHPEAVNAFMGVIDWTNGAMRAGIMPVTVEAPGRPVIAGGTRVDTIIAYLHDIGTRAGLSPLVATWDGEVAWLG